MGRLPRLRLRPFHAMRFDEAAVGDLGEVTSPPYDTMDRQMIGRLLDEHPRNIVRVVLPRLVGEPMQVGSPYLRAGQLLRRWRRQGVLRTDVEPGLYVYEYADASTTVRGLVGALELRKRSAGLVLPHEDVIPDMVSDRLALMVATRANLEPILLVYDGAGGTREVLDRATAEEPLFAVDAPDGTRHRVWAITDHVAIRAVNRSLAPQVALIADGHHRHASYQQLRRRHRSIGDGPGPWDRGLAMLIDQSEWPLRLSAIHRSVAELALTSVIEQARDAVYAVVDGAELGGALPPTPTEAGEFVVADNGRWVRLRRSAPADSVSDAELLHESMLPGWEVTPDRLGYHHDVAQTVHTAEQEAGVSVLMHPPSVDQVMTVARAGKVMPRKSTSFGPKPRTGLLMRSLDDEV